MTEPYEGYVWNLAVEDDETFLAEGLVVHNCRSTIVPVVNWKALGITPPRETLQGGQRGALFSPDPYRDYASWLAEQSAGEQDGMLGRAAAAQFRTGRASLADLVRADGRQLTVAQLAARLGP